MKNLFLTALLALVVTCAFGKNPPESVSVSTAKKAVVASYLIEYPNHLLENMFLNEDKWILSDETGQPVSYFSCKSSDFSILSTYNNQTLMLELNGHSFKVTGMRIDGNLSSAAHITVWLSDHEAQAEEWHVQSDYNLSSDALQDAVDLAKSYSIVMR